MYNIIKCKNVKNNIKFINIYNINHRFMKNVFKKEIYMCNKNLRYLFFLLDTTILNQF